MSNLIRLQNQQYGAGREGIPAPRQPQNRGLGYLDYIPEASTVAWYGNWGSDYYDNVPAAANLLDETWLRRYLAEWGFDLIGYTHVSGWVNPYVQVRAYTRKIFASDGQAASAMENAMQQFVQVRRDRFVVERTPFENEIIEPSGWAINCPPGSQAVGSGPQMRCEPIPKDRRTGNSFLPSDGGSFFDFSWVGAGETQPASYEFDAANYAAMPTVTDELQRMPRWVVPAALAAFVFLAFR